MANILTATEASNALRTTTADAVMLELLPMVDAYVYRATGRNWAADTTIAPLAKAAARMLLVLWYENPAMAASGLTTMSHGLTAALTQLEALALMIEDGEA